MQRHGSHHSECTRHLQEERKDKHLTARGGWVWKAVGLFFFHAGRRVDAVHVWRATVVVGP